MSDVLVRFTANVSYRCVGDMVHLSAAERKAVDKEAKLLDVHPAYEVIEPETTPVVEPTPVAEEVAEAPVETEEPAQPEEEASEPEATEPETTPVVETKSKSKKGAK